MIWPSSLLAIIPFSFGLSPGVLRRLYMMPDTMVLSVFTFMCAQSEYLVSLSACTFMSWTVDVRAVTSSA